MERLKERIFLDVEQDTHSAYTDMDNGLQDKLVFHCPKEGGVQDKVPENKDEDINISLRHQDISSETNMFG